MVEIVHEISLARQGDFHPTAIILTITMTMQAAANAEIADLWRNCTDPQGDQIGSV
jgi:hypothetical protein